MSKKQTIIVATSAAVILLAAIWLILVLRPKPKEIVGKPRSVDVWVAEVWPQVEGQRKYQYVNFDTSSDDLIIVRGVVAHQRVQEDLEAIVNENEPPVTVEWDLEIGRQ